MRLCDQRDTLTEASRKAHSDIRALMTSIRRKMAMPYGDGTKTNMVNAETDVLPALYEIALDLDATLSETVYG
ncbi:unnamed protein product [marine sediment metagenome]|uniref:Uncharacterized protein n=1 Tax=marine sediment metagenome TaxID=412755 RepID=X0TEI3_9ZZZZ